MPSEIIRTAIAKRAKAGSAAKDIASSVALSMSLLDLELSSLLGKQTTAALCAHAFHRTRSTVNWAMPPVSEFSKSTAAALEADLSARTPDGALRAGEALLFALANHLVSLIGPALTQRIFYTALSSFNARPDAQENSYD